MTRSKLTTIWTLVLIVLSVALLTACTTMTPDSETTPVVQEITKSHLDERQYQYKKLDNGLKVIVVSDPEADKAAASLDVHIGHLADPKNREGLSHYLEHMLFLGTQKYPEVGEYGEFISKHGGTHNAGTGMEHTSYFFQIDNNYLEPALDRFSRFFIDPLFDPKYVQKERNAVHSEYKLKVKDDARRLHEAVKQTANQAHPMTQFSVGNLSTLSDTETSNILADVKAHHKKYYSAGIMSLVVVGNYPTDQLMRWAENKFSAIPNNGYQPDYSKRPEPYLESQQGVKIGVQTLENKRFLELRFTLPEATQYYKEKPVNYISELLTYRSEGSLYDYLKSQGYIKNLYDYVYGPDDFTRFMVNIELTNKGYDNVDKVVEAFFAYLKLLKDDGVKQSTFEQMKLIKNNDFEYQSKTQPAYLARTLAGNLQYYPAKHALDISRVYDNFDPQLIKQFLAQLTPQNLRLVVSAPDISSKTKEERYDVAYTMQPLTQEQLQSWTNVKVYKAMSLPDANPYLAEDLSLVEKETAITEPKLGYENKGIRIWYENENEFGLPKAALSMRLFTPVFYDNDELKVIRDIFANYVTDQLATESYEADMAGLDFGLSANSRGFSITTKGYSPKLPQLLYTVLDEMMKEEFTKSDFERIKLNMIQNYQNSKFKRPISQVIAAIRNEVALQSISDDTALNIIENIDFTTFSKKAKELLNRVQVDSIYIGNISAADVKQLGDSLNTKLGQRLQDDIKPEAEVIALKSGEQFIREVSVDHNDSSLVWTFQGNAEDVEQEAAFRILSHLLKHRFYDSLRTQQQYGYIVQMFNFNFDQTPGLGLLIQSPKAHPAVLMQKFDEFIQDQPDYLSSLSQEAYDSQVKGLLSNLDKRLDNLSQKLGELSKDLYDNKYKFNSKKQLIEAVKAMPLSKVINVYKQFVAADTRASIAAWNIGHPHKNEASYKADGYRVCRVDNCVRQLAE
ncbi:insulinase family protein [Kangiella shandongensis]|uniref:insulinase family protein n=1 Tax=Kangiella shandongensis TaxID=2763258 RepID=UPI001CBE7E16|nr:insulinase family protein [Kangiella shandongensis]